MISRSGIHAIRALVVLAAMPEGAFIGAGDLARRIDAPQNYLGKLLQSLSRAGLAISRKGLGGGFRLAGDPAEITLRELLEPIEDIGRWEGCFLGLPECSEDAPCPIHEEWKHLRNDYLALLARTTLADILARDRTGSGSFLPDARARSSR